MYDYSNTHHLSYALISHHYFTHVVSFLSPARLSSQAMHQQISIRFPIILFSLGMSQALLESVRIPCSKSSTKEWYNVVIVEKVLQILFAACQYGTSLYSFLYFGYNRNFTIYTSMRFPQKRALMRCTLGQNHQKRAKRAKLFFNLCETFFGLFKTFKTFEIALFYYTIYLVNQFQRFEKI
mgnify:FL=1